MNGGAQLFPIASELPAELTGWLRRHQPHPIFGSPEWHQQLAAFKQRAHQSGAARDYLWLVVYGEDGPVLAAALEVRHASFGFTRLSLLQNYYTPWVGLFADPARLDPAAAWSCLLQALDQLYPRWLTFAAAPLDTASFASLQAASAARACPAFGRQVSVNQTAQFASADSYWQARPSRLRNTIKRKQKLLAKVPHQFELLLQPDPSQVDQYWQVYMQSWKPQEPSPSFINWLMAWSAQRDYLRLGLLHIGEKAVACQLWLVSGGCAYIFKLAQSIEADQYSPGTLLTGLMIDALCVRDQLTRIDFLLGGDPFKKMWMDDQRQVHGLELVNPRPLPGKLLALGYRTRDLLRARRPAAPADGEH